MSWFYAGINVINRKLKNVHYAVLGFYHPLFGIFVYLSYILVDYLIFDNGLNVHSYSVYKLMLLACALDFACFNLRNIAF